MRNSNRGYPPLIAIFAIIALAPGLLRAGEGTIRHSPNAVKDEYIVVLQDDIARDDVPGIARALARQRGGEVKRIWQDALKGFFVVMPEGQAQGLSHHPDVKYIEENAEMFISATVPTNVDPACTPAPGVTCATADNRLWHLDVIDQNSAAATNDYSYCETGSGVYVYVIDLGVMRAHREFNNDPNKVLDGYDASGDPAGFPAWNPCGGPGYDNQPPDGQRSPAGVRAQSHGTGVASLVNGLNLGVARAARVVPIKVSPCAHYGVRQLNINTPNTSYATNETVFANSTYYKVKVGGTTGPAGTYPYTGWPWPPAAACCQTWGSVQLEYLGNAAVPSEATVQMTIEGLDWILRPVSSGGNPYPKAPAVVSLSTYRVVGMEGATSPPPGMTLSVEDAIGNLLRYNNGQGITVVASANNQDANACDTTPGRMSRNNPNNPNNPDRPYKVITVGGTMLRNNPDPNPATGGASVNLPEPQYDPTQPTRFARWRCHAGDSDNCSGDIYKTPPDVAPSPIPYGPYINTTLGSNGGQCVTLFAPAKNIPVANHDALNTYRDSRATAGWASGTSWSAPIVAGVVARILQSNPTYNVDQVHAALMSRTGPDLDPAQLDPPNVSGTPNAVLRLTPVVVQPLPATTPRVNGQATITVTASGAAGPTYELYQVNAAMNAYATRIIGPQPSNTFSFAAASGTSYFARASSSCGSADTNVTTVTSVTAPTGVVATANGGTVTIQWNAVADADGYNVERKVFSAAWQLAQSVNGGGQTSVNDAPGTSTGVVLYRVVARSGTVTSAASSSDVAYAAGFTDDPIATTTEIQAVHITELRRAVNTLRAIGGQSAVYSAAALDPNNLRTQPVAAADFTTLMQAINAARSFTALPPVGFGSTPASGGVIARAHLESLRNGFK
ncbi:MAG TPA: S8 family serine peptidase [Thermoanaerobaculia bacterium]|nr:S8 family serine peptidase [Thermoanaerobaculia bacterium]